MSFRREKTQALEEASTELMSAVGLMLSEAAKTEPPHMVSLSAQTLDAIGRISARPSRAPSRGSSDTEGSFAEHAKSPGAEVGSRSPNSIGSPSRST